MTDSFVTVVGNLTAEPVVGSTKGGDVFTNFRVAVNHGYFDRERQMWLETGTSYYKVAAFRSLAVNAFESLTKGTPVVVQGRLRIVNWTNGDKQGTEAQIQAVAIGPNLSFGQADFTSVRRPQLSGKDPMADANVQGALGDDPTGATAGADQPEEQPSGAEDGHEAPHDGQDDAAYDGQDETAQDGQDEGQEVERLSA